MFCKIYCIATAVKTRHIVQCDTLPTIRNIHFASILPLPPIARGSKIIAQLFIAYTNGKTTCALLVGPRRGPVVASYIDVVGTRRRELHLGRGILNSAPHSVSNKVGRAHLEDELLIDTPAALSGKTLGLHPY